MIISIRCQQGQLPRRRGRERDKNALSNWTLSAFESNIRVSSNQSEIIKARGRSCRRGGGAAGVRKEETQQEAAVFDELPSQASSSVLICEKPSGGPTRRHEGHHQTPLCSLISAHANKRWRPPQPDLDRTCGSSSCRTQAAVTPGHTERRFRRSGHRAGGGNHGNHLIWQINLFLLLFFSNS